ncbi:MAG: hypothetical protein GXP33_12800 [Spirochaetes bacterium]|nr:hypothetical protein [Spirochaetota bacterium]
MINRNAGLFLFGPILSGLFGCTAVGGAPPPPLFPGPNPVLDRMVVSLQYFSPLFILIFIISLIAVGIYFIVFKNSSVRKVSKYSPKEIAQTRYASGELSREEYLTIMKDLESVEDDENKIEEIKDEQR